MLPPFPSNLPPFPCPGRRGHSPSSAGEHPAGMAHPTHHGDAGTLRSVMAGSMSQLPAHLGARLHDANPPVLCSECPAVTFLASHHPEALPSLGRSRLRVLVGDRAHPPGRGVSFPRHLGVTPRLAGHPSHQLPPATGKCYMDDCCHYGNGFPSPGCPVLLRWG